MRLYNYQEKYLEDLKPRAIMAADTGLGKTVMALEHYRRHAWGEKLLIIAPAAKVRTKDWEREIKAYFGANNMPDFEIYSYEKFSREPSSKQFREGKRAIYRRFDPYEHNEKAAIIADEIHKAKNPQSGIGKAVFKVARDADFFIGLSATPLPNGWIDFANYSKIFGFTKGITEFKKRYCNIQTFKGFPEIIGYWRERELERQWAGVAKRLKKSEADDLPERVFVGVNFKRPAEYVKTLIERHDEIGRPIENPSQLAHALRQTLTPVKMKYLSDIVEGTSENMVIFYNYISEREALLEMISKYHRDKVVFRQDGEKHQLPAKEDWHRVKNSLTLAQYKSGSTGVEMTYATQVVYLSPTYSYSDYLQSIGRVYRSGQTQKTTFFNFRTVNTIEESVYKALKNKGDFQEKQWAQALEEEA